MLNRRELIKRGAVTVAIFSGVLPGLRAAAAPPRTRRDITTLRDTDDTLLSLRQFIKDMRARPDDRLPNWNSIAAIHGTREGFNLCQHFNWYFLPWHRAYIEMIENMVMAHTGNARFAMPYWDWSALRTYPTAFTARLANGAPNPLVSPGVGDDPERIRSPRLTITDSIAGTARITSLLRQPSFELFASSRPVDGNEVWQNTLDPRWLGMRGVAGEFESSLHNVLHLLAGGAAGFMSSPESARDPLFLVHHTNVDRIWASWRGQNSTDPLWSQMQFRNHFMRMDGSHYTVKVDDLLDTTGRGYQYDRLLDVNLAGATGDARRLLQSATGQLPDTRVQVASPQRVGPAAALRFPRAARGGALDLALRTGDDVYAVLNDIHLSAHVVGVRVFVNLPDTADDASPEAPQFVSELGFLPGGHHGGGEHRHSASVNLSPALRRLASLGLLRDDTLTLRLVPVYAEGTDPGTQPGEVIPGAVTIGVL
ncbi:tyrosinase family protein [Stenotrophomonas sp. C3(2023)]|uniref:tyrosinase family protein n=1 Tax=Stenotrophomonas sp. C3(2023) TaxID=3080277 RepID=UPI00293D1313|nr:tyrosinase family protein [Stenotrophomonas sp. C3(2023)]MDV3468911.1 tyrosinase family protein [Stenotrophomonas sp. C3(2023)]